MKLVLLFLLFVFSQAIVAAPPEGYRLCAAENAVCEIASPSTVVYGAGEKWTAPKAVSADTPCTNAVFGDPVVGVVKSCWIKAQATPPVAVHPCGAGTPAATTVLYNDMTDEGNAYRCAPAPAGTGTALTLRLSPEGATAWWYCPTPEGKWRLSWAAATPQYLLSSAIVADVYRVIGAPDPLAELRATTKRNAATRLDAPELARVWCPWFDEMLHGAPPNE